MSGKPGQDHPTKAEREKRLAYTEGVMLSEPSDRLSAKRVAAKYGITLRSAQNYVTEVRERWSADAATRDRVERDAKREEHRARFMKVFRKAMALARKESDARALKEANAAAARVAQLDGFLSTSKLEVSGSVTHRHELDLQQREAARSILLRRGYVAPDPVAEA